MTLELLFRSWRVRVFLQASRLQHRGFTFSWLFNSRASGTRYKKAVMEDWVLHRWKNFEAIRMKSRRRVSRMLRQDKCSSHDRSLYPAAKFSRARPTKCRSTLFCERVTPLTAG